MTNNTPDYKDNLYFDAQNTKDEQQKDLCIKVEKQVWESTLHRSMVLEADNKRLKHDVGNLGYKIKNQRHEIDNRLKEIAKLKELLKECREPLEVLAEKRNACDWCPENLLAKIDEVLK